MSPSSIQGHYLPIPGPPMQYRTCCEKANGMYREIYFRTGAAHLQYFETAVPVYQRGRAVEP